MSERKPGVSGATIAIIVVAGILLLAVPCVAGLFGVALFSWSSGKAVGPQQLQAPRPEPAKVIEDDAAKEPSE